MELYLSSPPHVFIAQTETNLHFAFYEKNKWTVQKLVCFLNAKLGGY
jgi:hypothetical protein